MNDPIQDAIDQGRADADERRAKEQLFLQQAPVEAQKLGDYIERSVTTGLQDLQLNILKPMDLREGANARTLEMRKPTGILVRLRIVVEYGSTKPDLEAYAAFNGKKQDLRLVYSPDQLKFTENIGHFRAAIIEAAKRLAS